ncbi:MAG TPA: hypothetical protein VGS03_08245 [Candidatus Polarisedimenticolia bacterium]|nr:hypothetical protein [Candidatus Polarisedimenticolia bacterium]
MVETPAQPSHAAALVLLAGFILLLVFEMLFVPGASRRAARDVELPQDVPAASQRAAQEAPPLPTPAP